LPWRRGNSPVSAAPEYEDSLFEQWSRGVFDAYWKQPGIWAEGFYDRYSPVPVVHLSGWYDPYARTATDNYLGLSRAGRAPQRLILGPWTHGDRSLSHAGEVDFGEAAPVDGNLAGDFFELRRRWFDCWVRGVSNGVEAEPKVRVFVMGGGSGRRNRDGRLDHGGRWRAASEWPLPETRWTRFYLHPDRGLGPVPAAGTGALDYVFDPRDPASTRGGAISSGEPVMQAGAFDQSAAADRPDVLVFTTPPLDDDLEIVGPVRARLWIASDAPDTDFTARLIDLYPPSADHPSGFAMNLTEGLLRVRYRDSWEHPAPMTPGEVYAITIELFPIGNLFRRGHRLRLDISSSNFPHFDVNPNSGEPEGAWCYPRPARNRIFAAAERPSHILLPVLPKQAATDRRQSDRGRAF
ncbi:MAG: CocE/NonD family hydrolase, partial [Alphaproteobacteria bacterium]